METLEKRLTDAQQRASEAEAKGKLIARLSHCILCFGVSCHPLTLSNPKHRPLTNKIVWY